MNTLETLPVVRDIQRSLRGKSWLTFTEIPLPRDTTREGLGIILREMARAGLVETRKLSGHQRYRLL